MFMEYPRMVFLWTSLCLLSILVGSFASYHLYLAVTNQTTNERYKSTRTLQNQYLSQSAEKAPKRTKGKGIEKRTGVQRTQRIYRNLKGGYSKGVLRNLVEVFFPADGKNRSR